MTSNTQRIRNKAHEMIDGGLCLEGSQLEAWLDSRAPLAVIDSLPYHHVTRFLQSVSCATVGPSQLEVRRRIDGLITYYFSTSAMA